MKRIWRAIHQYDYMGHKKWWFAVSAVVILAGLVSLFVRGDGNPINGLRYGLEFKSGTRINVEFDRVVTLAAVRDVVDDFDTGTPVIQSTGTGALSGREFLIQTEALSTEKERALRTELDEQFGIAETADGAAYASQTVGPSFGRDVITASWKAMIIALVIILIYISIRFAWKFAVGTIAAEMHDVLIVIGIYSLSGREVTTATIAAVLTIVGYSLYDNVIIFDRIRENEPRMRGMRYGDMVNRSIWETLTRSVNTSLITLLPVLCLLIFGGVTLKDFAFALTVGIISGAYSSFFVACPVATILKEREPQYRKVIARQSGANASS